MSKYIEIKEELKTLARKIKKTREEYKKNQRNGEYNLLWRIDADLRDLIYEFRHNHIAMSIIRGHTREEIEKPAKDNLPNEHYITALVESYKKLLYPEEEDHEQTLRLSA